MASEFWPADTETEIYYANETSLAEILESIKTRWPNISMTEISIQAEYIHTHCLGYDLYDSSDYTNFVVVRKTEERK